MRLTESGVEMKPRELPYRYVAWSYRSTEANGAPAGGEDFPGGGKESVVRSVDCVMFGGLAYLMDCDLMRTNRDEGFTVVMYW